MFRFGCEYDAPVHGNPDVLRGSEEFDAGYGPDGSLWIRHQWLPAAWRKKYFPAALLIIAILILLVSWPDSWDSLILPGIFFCIISYAATAAFFNHTRLVVSSGTMHWRHGPLPLRRGGKLRTDSIEAVRFGRILKSVSAEELTRRHRDGYSSTPTYGVAVRRAGGKIRCVFDGVRSEQSVDVTARLIAGQLGGMPVEHEQIRDPLEPSDLFSWIAVGATLLVMAGLAYMFITMEP